MNFQTRLIEATSDLRARAAMLATPALAKRVDSLKDSVVALTVAGRALNKVAQRHASRFVKENTSMAVAAGKDLGALARSTYATLSGREAAAKPARKVRVARKRASSKAR